MEFERISSFEEWLPFVSVVRYGYSIFLSPAISERAVEHRKM